MTATHHILLDRLALCGIGPNHEHDPWGAGFLQCMVQQGTSEEATPYGDRELSPSWHAERIRFLMRHLDDQAPIYIDCFCDGPNILAIPVIVDGWHRLHAHWALGRKTIPIHFGGRVDLLEGTTDELPTD